MSEWRWQISSRRQRTRCTIGMYLLGSPGGKESCYCCILAKQGECLRNKNRGFRFGTIVQTKRGCGTRREWKSMTKNIKYCWLKTNINEKYKIYGFRVQKIIIMQMLCSVKLHSFSSSGIQHPPPTPLLYIQSGASKSNIQNTHCESKNLVGLLFQKR